MRQVLAAEAPQRSLRALAALLLVTILWGFSFVWMKQNLEAAARILGGPAGWAVVSFFVAVRFGAAAILLAFWPRARTGLDRGAWWAGLVLGALLFFGFVLQILGLEGVTPPVSAFLTSLYVVFAALLTAIMKKSRPRLALLAGIALATFGAGFIEGPPNLTFGLPEWLTVLCALIFAVVILATDRLTKTHAPLAVTLASFVATGALGAGSTLLALADPRAPTMRALAALLADPDFVRPLVLLTLFSTVAALTLMNLFQREIDPVRASIIYSLEPIWATVIAFAYGLGRPTAWLVVGGCALLAGNLVAEFAPVFEANRTK
jgi:drug/metabolite transporter (DMT)-like permease